MLIAQLNPQSNVDFIQFKDRSLVRVTQFEGSNSKNSTVITEAHHESKLAIGKYVSISIGCNFVLGGNHDMNKLTTYLPFDLNNYDKDSFLKTNGDIVIGNDVWIGQGVTIMSGVSVGHGAIVAANSTVTKDVEPYTIVGGVPAKTIRKRFNEETIKFLLDSKWWDIPKNIIEENKDLIWNQDIDKSLSFIKEYRKSN